jgi:hypothetical protein
MRPMGYLRIYFNRMAPMLRDTSAAACRRILEPYHSQLWEIAAGGVACFRSLPAEHQLILASSKRCHRTMVWQFMMWEAARLLSATPNVLPLRKFETTNYEIDGRVLVRFKKLDPDGMSSNYPTPRALSFVGDEQYELFEAMWSAPLRVDVGYVLDKTGLGVELILVSRRRGSKVDWIYPIPAPANGVLTLPLRPAAPLAPAATTATRVLSRGERERALKLLREEGS